MNINETIDQYFTLEKQIGKHFDTEIYEGLTDLRNVKWDYEEGGDVAWIEDDALYQAEVYGTSVWQTEELMLCTLFSDFGGKYQAIFKQSNKDEDVWE